ncbi:MAG: hypothetical protein ACE10D_02480 [Planctomycetota bacterium]
MSPTEVTVPVADASRLLLAGCGLTDDPGRRALPKTVYKAIERMGFALCWRRPSSSSASRWDAAACSSSSR